MGHDVIELHSGTAVLLLGTPTGLRRMSGRLGRGRTARLSRFAFGDDNRRKLRRFGLEILHDPGSSHLTDSEVVAAIDRNLESGRLVALELLPGTATRSLLSNALVQRAQVALAEGPVAAGAASASQGGAGGVAIGDLSYEQRLVRVLGLATARAPRELGQILRELASPENLAILLGIIGVAAVAQETPAGPVVDAALLATAYWYGGMAAVHGVLDLFTFARLVITARRPEDLDRAADALVSVAVTLAAIGLIALLHRTFASASSGGVAEAEEAGAASRRPGDPRPRSPRSNAGSSPSPTPAPEPPPPPPNAAKQLLAKAAAAEKSVTPDLQQAAAAQGMKMEGLEYRLKTEESLARKLGDTPPDQIRDALRYTMVSDSQNMAANVSSTLGDLESKGYKVLKVKNTFKDGASYKGVNTQILSPDGQPFELQFHTPESFNVKQNLTHGIYEEYRLLPADSPRAAELQKQLTEISNTIPNPPGLADALQGFRK